MKLSEILARGFILGYFGTKFNSFTVGLLYMIAAAGFMTITEVLLDTYGD